MKTSFITENKLFVAFLVILVTLLIKLLFFHEQALVVQPCYSCLVDGYQRSCHRSGTYYRQWPCSNSEGSSYHPQHDVDNTLCRPRNLC